MQHINVRVEGVTPLLMNRMSEAQLLRIHRRLKAPKSKNNEVLPRDEALEKLHTTGKGVPCVPAEMLLAALVEAGRYVRLDGKRQLSTAKSSLVPGVLTILTARMPIAPGDWEVDIRQGRNPNGGEGVCLIRPRFDAWAFDAEFVFDAEAIGEKQTRELWDIALSRVGLGDFRPARKGPFGRSIVKCWEQNGHL